MSIAISPEQNAGYVLFPIPVARVPEIGRLLYGTEDGDPAGIDESHGEPAFANDEELAKLIERIYLESEPKFRKIMLSVADRVDPEQPLWYTEVTTAIGWPTPRSLPGALGAYGRRAKHRYKGFWPVKRNEDPVTGEMYLNTDVVTAKHIRDTHEKYDLPTSEEA